MIDKRLQINLRKYKSDEERISHQKEAEAAWDVVSHLEQDRRLFSFKERRTKACFPKVIYQRPEERVKRNIRSCDRMIVAGREIHVEECHASYHCY